MSSLTVIVARPMLNHILRLSPSLPTPRRTARCWMRSSASSGCMPHTRSATGTACSGRFPTSYTARPLPTLS